MLDLLLSELEVEDPPAGTIQRFTEFKRVLKTWKDQGKRVFIVVEDAQRIGVDAISELESLTSESNGGACGASIVLMGLPEVNDLLSSAALARTRQRTSLQLTLNPFDPTEVQDYLAHQFSIAGGNIDDAFASGAVDMIHRCTGGSPRVINKLCEAVLNAAAEADSKPVLPSLVEQIASQEFGLVAQQSQASQDVITAAAESVPAEPVEEPVAQLIQDTLPGVEALVPDTINDAPVDAAVETETKFVPEDRSAPGFNTTILEPQEPEQLTKATADTASVRQLDSALRPDTHLLRVLDELPPQIDDLAPVPLGLQGQMKADVSESAPSVGGDRMPEEEPIADAGTQQTVPVPTADLPTLSDSMRIEPLQKSTESKDSGDTQTLRRPNIEAFESAMATARKGPVELDIDAPPLATEDAVSTKPVEERKPAADVANIPEITLDNCLEERRQEAEQLLEEKKAQQEAADADNAAKAQEKLERAKLGKLASDVGKAKSLEEIDDVAAETLFGEEFSQIAAAVAAMAAEDSANDSDIVATLDSDETSKESVDDLDSNNPGEPATSRNDEESPPVSVESVTPAEAPPALDINASASRRFAMLQAIKEQASDGPDRMPEKIEKKEPELAPSENQFCESMTATLAALKFDKPLSEEDDEPESSGFLSRFKRS